MNQEQFTNKLKEATNGAEYAGQLSNYALTSITLGRSNYPVQNLIFYLHDMGLRLVLEDMATEQEFFADSVLAIHKVLNILMHRYQKDAKLVYRKTAIHYTTPKSFDQSEIDCMESKSEGRAYAASLSIKTLLAVCEVIYCDIKFIKSDESSVINNF